MGNVNNEICFISTGYSGALEIIRSAISLVCLELSSQFPQLTSVEFRDQKSIQPAFGIKNNIALPTHSLFNNHDL